MRFRSAPTGASTAVASGVPPAPGGAVVTFNPPYAGGDSAGNLKLNASGKVVLIRFVARYTGALSKLHFQVRNLVGDGASYTGGTLGTYKCELRRALPDGKPNMTAAGLVASETFLPSDARIVNYNAYMNVSPNVACVRGDEFFLCVSNTDPAPATNYASVNFLYQGTSPIPGAQGRNERDPYATDLYVGLDPRELVGGTSDGGSTYQIPGNIDAANTLVKHIFAGIQEYADGTKKYGNLYYTVATSGVANGAWVMTYRNVSKPWHISHIGCWLQAVPGSDSVVLKVDGVARATAVLTGSAGFNIVKLSNDVFVQPGSVVTIDVDIDSTGSAGLGAAPVYTRSEWASLVGGAGAMDWEATTKPAGVTGAFAAAALPVWPLPWKDAGQLPSSALAVDLGLFAQKFKSGRYYGGPGGLSTSLPGEGAMFAWPFIVGERTTFDRIGIETTIGGSAGAVSRLGVYADDGDSSPGALVLDAGTVVATGVGYVENTIALTLDPGVYWLECCTQGGATTRPTYRVNTGSSPAFPLQAGALSGILATGAGSGGANTNTSAAAGALPNVFPAVTATASAPRVVLRAA